ncbi:MAG: DUF433 domain-containing protein [Patescibacteria group bacterium]
MHDFTKYIVSRQNICHGKPVFKSTRIMVWQILEMLAVGESINDILRAYPSLTKAHVTAALQLAARLPEIRGSFIISPDHAISR